MESSDFEIPALESLVIPDDNRILYYRRDRQMYRFFSHFFPSPIEIDGETWPTVEHFYQAAKSTDRAYVRAIREAKTAGHAKRLAAPPDGKRRLAAGSWFRANGKLPRADWHEVKLDVMRRGDMAKFSQNPALAELLLATGTAELIEDSATEPFWGIGKDGLGQNWAGRVLMEVREQLRRKG